MAFRAGGPPRPVAGRQTEKARTVVGAFHDRRALNRAVRELTSHGIPSNAIRIVVRAADGRRSEVGVEAEAGTLRGVLIGAGAGALVGACVVGLLAAGVFGDPVRFTGVGLVGALRIVLLLAAAAVPLGGLIGMGRWRSRGKISEPELERGAEIAVSPDLTSRALSILGTP